MPYATDEDLPPPVRNHLPPHARDIYRAAFNHAYAAHGNDPRREEAAHRIAWAAVKRCYVKVDGEWVARSDRAGVPSPHRIRLRMRSFREASSPR